MSAQSVSVALRRVFPVDHVVRLLAHTAPSAGAAAAAVAHYRAFFWHRASGAHTFYLACGRAEPLGGEDADIEALLREHGLDAEMRDAETFCSVGEMLRGAAPDFGAPRPAAALELMTAALVHAVASVPRCVRAAFGAPLPMAADARARAAAAARLAGAAATARLAASTALAVTSAAKERHAGLVTLIAQCIVEIDARIPAIVPAASGKNAAFSGENAPTEKRKRDASPLDDMEQHVACGGERDRDTEFDAYMEALLGGGDEPSAPASVPAPAPAPVPVSAPASVPVSAPVRAPARPRGESAVAGAGVNDSLRTILRTTGQTFALMQQSVKEGAELAASAEAARAASARRAHDAELALRERAHAAALAALESDCARRLAAARDEAAHADEKRARANERVAQLEEVVSAGEGEKHTLVDARRKAEEEARALANNLAAAERALAAERARTDAPTLAAYAQLVATTHALHGEAAQLRTENYFLADRMRRAAEALGAPQPFFGAPPVQNACFDVPPVQNACFDAPPSQNACFDAPPSQNACFDASPALSARFDAPLAQSACFDARQWQEACGGDENAELDTPPHDVAARRAEFRGCEARSISPFSGALAPVAAQ